VHTDKTKCIGCANCVAVCPMEAIHIGDDGLSDINEEACVECHTCYNGMSTEHLWQQPTRFIKGVLAFFKLRFDPELSPEQMIKEMKPPGGGVLVVFDNKPALEEFLKEVKEMDLGLSVNVSSLVDDVREMIPRTGVVPHSINYALGFRGSRYRLPDRNVLELTTLCGHGLISNNFARKMINMVKERRVSPKKAAGYMSKFCVCGAFNTTRAVRILQRAITSSGRSLTGGCEPDLTA